MALKEIPKSEGEEQQPRRAYLFDIDGVLTNPLNNPMTKKEMLHALSERMHHEVIGFNSGQSLSFIEKQVLEPLEARVRDRTELDHLIAIGEKGGAWITYDQDGRRTAHINEALRLPMEFQNEVRALAERQPYSDVMFYDEAKQTMVTVQILWGLSLEAYKKHQRQFVEQAQKLLTHHHLDGAFKIDPHKKCSRY